MCIAAVKELNRVAFSKSSYFEMSNSIINLHFFYRHLVVHRTVTKVFSCILTWFCDVVSVSKSHRCTLVLWCGQVQLERKAIACFLSVSQKDWKVCGLSGL